jgi:pimeloyl-ACP methyl ester carboxylesterase
MPFFFNTLRAGLGAIALSFPLTAAADDASVILTHGAFADGSAWHKVIPILQEAGVSVTAAQLPLTSLSDDAAVLSRLIEAQAGPVVLVGHSYGGMVISEAGAHENVEALVFVAAFALDAGESLAKLQEGNPPSAFESEFRPDAAGFVRFSAEGYAQYFAPDLPAKEAAVLAATQGAIQYQINYEAPTVAAWSMHPTYYVIAENDQLISQEAQGFFAQRMGAKVTSVAASHAAMLSQPQAVADVILEAVEMASSN